MDNVKKSAISRRDFITKLWGFVVAMPFLYSAFKFISPPGKRFISPAQKLSGANGSSSSFSADSIPVNSSKLVNIDDEPVIVIRKSDKDIIALSAVCTHLNCVVGFRTENKDIFCACHGGRYDLNGIVIEGPPKLPLLKYNVSINSNLITVSKIS
jgi:cytochrome b6-f complex iron-sulfur subunit